MVRTYEDGGKPIAQLVSMIMQPKLLKRSVCGVKIEYAGGVPSHRIVPKFVQLPHTPLLSVPHTSVWNPGLNVLVWIKPLFHRNSPDPVQTVGPKQPPPRTSSSTVPLTFII